MVVHLWGPSSFLFPLTSHTQFSEAKPVRICLPGKFTNKGQYRRSEKYHLPLSYIFHTFYLLNIDLLFRQILFYIAEKLKSFRCKVHGFRVNICFCFSFHRIDEEIQEVREWNRQWTSSRDSKLGHPWSIAAQGCFDIFFIPKLQHYCKS